MSSMTPYELELSTLFAIEKMEVDGGTANIGDIRRFVGNDEDAAELARRLVGSKKLRRGNSLVGDYYLTLEGKAQIDSARERQNSRQWRRTRCRMQMLTWLDNQGPVETSVDIQAFAGALDALPFDEDEVAEAISYLIEVDFATALGPRFADGRWSIVAITRLGSDCIDSNREILAYLESQNRSQPPAGHTFNVSGTGNTLATATADGATASAHVANTFNMDGARLFAQAVRAAENNLVLNDEARAALTEIETTEDATTARRATSVLVQFIAAASAGAVGQVLGVYGGDLLGL